MMCTAMQDVAYGVVVVVGHGLGCCSDATRVCLVWRCAGPSLDNSTSLPELIDCIYVDAN